jgi:hypothetical protein
MLFLGHRIADMLPRINPYIQSQIDAERRRLDALAADDSLWQRHNRRIGVVLSGGGARGAYEAGVLLAFGHAKLPTCPCEWAT